MVVYATDCIDTRAQAHSLLTRGAKEVWGLSDLPPMERSGDGKPGFPDFPACQFNLSHSEPFGLCALDSAPVGADLQRIRTNLRPGLPKRVCSPEELGWLEAQPDRHRAFATLWVLKEAAVKYTGTGLRVDVRAISVPLPAPGQTLYRHNDLWFRIYTGELWMAAVCGENIPPEHLIWV